MNSSDSGADAQALQDVVIPVLREDLEVYKVTRETGSVRIRKIVHESEEVISEELAAETVEVERIPMNLTVENPPPVRTEGDVTIISVVKEILVLSKQLRVIEELRITRRRSVVNQQQTVTLRAEELMVERQAPEE